MSPLTYTVVGVAMGALVSMAAFAAAMKAYAWRANLKMLGMVADLVAQFPDQYDTQKFGEYVLKATKGAGAHFPHVQWMERIKRREALR
jgi:hypothetical protein